MGFWSGIHFAGTSRLSPADDASWDQRPNLPIEVADSPKLNIRVINAATGEILRELTLNPDKDYQPQNDENS